MRLVCSLLQYDIGLVGGGFASTLSVTQGFLIDMGIFKGYLLLPDR